MFSFRGMKNYCNRKLILWSLLCWISRFFQCWAQKPTGIDCLSDELVTSIFNDPIDLNLRGIIKIYENVTINEILSSTNNEFEQNYIDARLENSNSTGRKNLVLFTTEHFENYAKEQTAARISLKINLGCGMEKERVVIFFQPLKEGNYFGPVFSKTNYELIVPTPIFVGFDLTAFLEITAKDDDLTHNQINFTSNDSLQYYIRVGTKNVTSADKKLQFAALTLERILLELPQAIEFEIVATDNGDPPRSSRVSVKIDSDPKRSLPAKPKFVQSLYKGNIDVDFHMESIKMELVNGTYSSEVDFFLSEPHAEGFHLEDNKNGSLEVIWSSSGLNRSEILKQGIRQLEVIAEHKKLAEFGIVPVLVEMADIKNNFHFISSFYEGHINELGELHISPIIFNPYVYQSDMEFSLQDSYDFFNLMQQNFSIQLHLNANFTWQSVDDMRFVKLTLQASWENLLSKTNVIINMPQIKNDTAQQLFQFEKPLYVGHLNLSYELELETIVLQTDRSVHMQEIEFDLIGTESDKFYMMRNGSNIKIKRILNNLIMTNIKLNNSILLVLEANYRAMKTYASVVIYSSTTETNVFLKPAVMGQLMVLNDLQKLSMESISVANELKVQLNDLSLHLKGDHAFYFEVQKNVTSHKIEIALKTPLPSSVLATRQLLNLSLQAALPERDAFNDTLWLFIELPIRECPATLLPSLSSPQFSNTNYVFTVHTNQTGILGIVNAFNKGGGNSTLHYTLGVPDDLLAQCLSINPFTGELFLYDTIAEGNYPFNITAENNETRDRAVVRALLKVQRKEKDCKPFEGTAVEKTLMILHVDEEKPNYGLVNMTFNENCSFQIEEMWPNDKEYVNINFLFHMLDAIAIDREDDIFANMFEPQIKVKLRLTCSAEPYHNELSIDVTMPENSRSSQIIFNDDIPYAPDVMWLYLIIDDINDNPPEFKIPEGPIFLGYPSDQANLAVYPEYLIQIEATDRDVGYNADILYAIKTNSHFAIEPKTGRIYPKGGALDRNKQTEIIVMAIDQNGNGLVSRTVVVVKGLSSDFYSLVTFEEGTAKTKQQIETSMSQKFGYDINILKMSYVPQNSSQQRSRLAPKNFSCKAWIYAYKQQQLVTHQEIEEQFLSKSPDLSVKNVESYNEAVAMYSPSSPSSNLGYLIAIISLSLLSCSCLVFIIWRFCYHSTLTTTRKCDRQTCTGNRQQLQQINAAACSHGAENLKDCCECNNRDNNHVKFSDLIENGIEVEMQTK